MPPFHKRNNRAGFPKKRSESRDDNPKRATVDGSEIRRENHRLDV